MKLLTKFECLISVVATTMASIFFVGAAIAADGSASKYKADVPSSVVTPNSSQSKYLGELSFVDGFPTDSTIEKSYDFLDTSRAVQLFESGMATDCWYYRAVNGCTFFMANP